MAFDALRPMPIEQLALRSKIAERSGEHIYFPNGQIYPGRNLRTVTPRPQIFVGWTTRFFLYLPKTPTTNQAQDAKTRELERSELRIYYKQLSDNKEWWLGIRTERDRVILPHKRGKEDKEAEGKPQIPVEEGLYFSVALRAKDEDYIEALFNEKQMLTWNGDKIPGYDWLIQYKTGIQTLLSWHTTDELNYKNNLWGRYFRMDHRWWPTGTVAAITVFVKTVPSKTTITLWGSQPADVDFSSKNVKNNTTLRFTVTLSAQKTYVTSDFSGNKVVGLSPNGSAGPHYIETEFPKGLLIHKIETVVPSFTAPP